MSQKHQPGYMPYDRTSNRLLIRSFLGKNKPTNYSIPNARFSYGKRTSHDQQHAGDLMYSWNEHLNSENKNIQKIKDMIQTNKAALKEKAITSKNNYLFRKKQTIYKSFKEAYGYIKINLPDQSFRYGKPGELQDPIKLVLTNQYIKTDGKIPYKMPVKLTNKKRNKILSCYVTKNHQLVKEYTQKKMQLFQNKRCGSANKQWKLAKFNKVQKKVDSYNNRPFTTGNHSKQRPKTMEDNDKQDLLKIGGNI